MRRNKRRAIAASIVVVGGSLLRTGAIAAEQGMSTYTKGLAGFMSGFIPPVPGFYSNNTYYHFDGSAGSEVRDGRVELNVGLAMDAGFVEGLDVTHLTILGGNYAVGAGFGYSGIDIHGAITGPLGNVVPFSAGNVNFTDSIFVPAIIGWHDGDFHYTAELSVYVPTGSYRQDGTSLARNVWGFWPQFGATWYDPKSGWEVSGTMLLDFTTENPATKYQSGDIFHFDWAGGLHYEQWEFGISGNVMEQFTGDTDVGAKLGPFKAGSAGIGPAITYTATFGKLPVNFGVKWEHDLAAKNTFRGEVVTASLSMPL